PVLAVDELGVGPSGDGDVFQFGQTVPILLGDPHQREGDGGRDAVGDVGHEVDVLFVGGLIQAVTGEVAELVFQPGDGPGGEVVGDHLAQRGVAGRGGVERGSPPSA